MTQGTDDRWRFHLRDGAGTLQVTSTHSWDSESECRNALERTRVLDQVADGA